MFVGITVVAILSGIFLVALILFLDMTVAVGLINGFIFYANVLASSSATFFPSSKTSFPNVFVAWLNLDIGLDVCYIDGLDTYTKTWLQLVFPSYIIFLVIVVILASEYSSTFAKLIGIKNPVATLATLILLSYAKLLSVTIVVLSFATLHYPDGSKAIVWLPDGNVKYFQGKHLALVLAALGIVTLGVPYTFLLLSWQVILRAPNWWIFKWTRHTKLNAFITTYHVPYNSKHRYWPGLLLIVRIVLYIAASVSVSEHPNIIPFLTVVLVGGLLFLKGIIRSRIYKNAIVDMINTALYFNILVLAAFSLVFFKSDAIKQITIAYISTLVTFILLVVAITYHTALLIKSRQKLKQQCPSLQTGYKNSDPEATQSSIELPTQRWSPSKDVY